MTNTTSPVTRAERRAFMFTMRALVLLMLCIVVFMLGRWAGIADERAADITVLPCSAYAATSTPDIPAHTFTGACATEDGTLSVPNKN